VTAVPIKEVPVKPQIPVVCSLIALATAIFFLFIYLGVVNVCKTYTKSIARAFAGTVPAVLRAEKNGAILSVASGTLEFILPRLTPSIKYSAEDPLAGLITFNGAVVAAGTNPVRSDGTGANTYALEVQISQAIGATNATNIGLAAFNSAQFTVDPNGFVSASGSVPIQFTADSGTATPAAGNINILGGPGVTTSATGSTVTINSVVFTDQGGTTSVTADSGSFATAAITLTLPATPVQGEVCEFVATTAAILVVDAPSTHLIRIGNAISSAGGTASSSGLAGDALVLRYRASTTTWHATSVIGVWITA